MAEVFEASGASQNDRLVEAAFREHEPAHIQEAGLEVLMRKRLILPDPQPRIMNETFRALVTTAETPETVREWEGEAGESSWPMIRNLALVLVAVGLGVVALTQNQAMQTVTAVVTGVGTVIAGLFRLIGFLGGRRTPTAADAASGAS